MGELENVMPDYSRTGDIALKNQNTLRRFVGILGILLPFLVCLFLQLTNNFDLLLPSLSHYYFTRAGSIFEIVVSLLAIFLLIYKGEEFIDFILSVIAGVSALLMLIFPTGNLKGYNHSTQYDDVAVTCFLQSDFRPKFHYGCAALFLLCLAAMALFLFTKSSHAPKFRTKNKKRRNRIYRVCGILMLLALITAFLGFLGVIHDDFYEAHYLTFWMEFVAIESFGIAWMVKGELVFKDP